MRRVSVSDTQSVCLKGEESQMEDPLPKQYLEAIELFNSEDFFECHDELEELWSEMQGGEKKFLQGMIQASVALFHFGNENLGGAKKVYISAVKYLEPFLPGAMGVDLEKFLVDLKFCFQELLDNNDTYPQGIALRDERVPKIELSL